MKRKENILRSQITHYKKLNELNTINKVLIMKTVSITLRVSGEDKKLIQKAAVKFHKETGAKVSISDTIRNLVKQYCLSS